MQLGTDTQTQTDIQTCVTTIHFATSTTHAKCNYTKYVRGQGHMVFIIFISKCCDCYNVRPTMSLFYSNNRTLTENRTWPIELQLCHWLQVTLKVITAVWNLCSGYNQFPRFQDCRSMLAMLLAFVHVACGCNASYGVYVTMTSTKKLVFGTLNYWNSYVLAGLNDSCTPACTKCGRWAHCWTWLMLRYHTMRRCRSCTGCWSSTAWRSP